MQSTPKSHQEIPSTMEVQPNPPIVPAPAAAVTQPNNDIILKITTQRNASSKLTTRLLSIVTAAFANDDTFGWRYPNRKTYPSHFRRLFWRYLGAELLNPSVWVVVAYLRDENEEEIPVGYATWQRMGKGAMEETEVKWRDCWLQSTERLLFSLQERVTSFVSPIDCYKPAVNLMRESFKETEHYLATTPQFEKYLHLNILVVDPSYQRRGIGEALVKWGVKKARKDNIPSALEASVAGKKVYSKCGFEEMRVLDAYHPDVANGGVWREGMHCRDPDCKFAKGTFMTFDPRIQS
ncbi:hypothetical protein TWF694_005410 [Orbilia ellipsospora]|uniref:N-acetyltransferase domain-containing protein n=1 Tax=Orbilia ellipsospora TaxID=2528407 RepID=A0AAV9WU29_9PEZI